MKMKPEGLWKRLATLLTSRPALTVIIWVYFVMAIGLGVLQYLDPRLGSAITTGITVCSIALAAAIYQTQKYGDEQD